jgi:hypothetical protein
MARHESLTCGELIVGGSAANGTPIKGIKKYTSGTITIGAHTGGVAQSTSVTLTGVKATDRVLAVFPLTPSEAILATAVVSAANTVLLKTIGGTVDPADGVWEFLIASF